MAFHAKLSPSSAHRWMNCPGSVQLIGDESSIAGTEAHRGTAAHKIIETMLENGETEAHAYLNRLVVVHKPGIRETVIVPPGSPPTLDLDWEVFECDDTMVAGVQLMIDQVNTVWESCFDPVLYTERYLDMTWLDSRLGGTADVTIVDPGWIHLLDYKNGRIVVEVNDNEQMKNYAVGLLHEHPEAQGVTVHLVQPNAIHEEGTIRAVSYTNDELRVFQLHLKEAADAVSKPNAPRRPGDWCTYCIAKTRCPEFDETALAEAGMDFASDPVESPPLNLLPDPLADDDNGEAYRAALARKSRWVPVIDAWARDISQAILNELLNGRDVPGKKLVYGKSNRAYVNDEKTTAVALAEGGLPADELYSEPKLKSPAQVEKLRPAGMKPAQVKKLVAGLVHKPPGRVTVADADDPRQAVDPVAAAVSDFADDPVEE